MNKGPHEWKSASPYWPALSTRPTIICRNVLTNPLAEGRISSTQGRSALLVTRSWRRRLVFTVFESRSTKVCFLLVDTCMRTLRRCRCGFMPHRFFAVSCPRREWLACGAQSLLHVTNSLLSFRCFTPPSHGRALASGTSGDRIHCSPDNNASRFIPPLFHLARVSFPPATPPANSLRNDAWATHLCIGGSGAGLFSPWWGWIRGANSRCEGVRAQTTT